MTQQKRLWQQAIHDELGLSGWRLDRVSEAPNQQSALAVLREARSRINRAISVIENREATRRVRDEQYAGRTAAG